jgi:carboxypeptidase Taq
MITGAVAVGDLPQEWNDRMEAWLGVRPLNDSEGVLQDIHWSLGAIGYFPTYALGNLMSVQLFDAAKAAIPNLDEHFRAGDFSPLLGWLRTNVHQWGRRRTASEILVAATGSDLDATPWMTYLRRKYEALVAR